MESELPGGLVEEDEREDLIDVKKNSFALLEGRDMTLDVDVVDSVLDSTINNTILSGVSAILIGTNNC